MDTPITTVRRATGTRRQATAVDTSQKIIRKDSFHPEMARRNSVSQITQNITDQLDNLEQKLSQLRAKRCGQSSEERSNDEHDSSTDCVPIDTSFSSTSTSSVFSLNDSSSSSASAPVFPLTDSSSLAARVLRRLGKSNDTVDVEAVGPNHDERTNNDSKAVDIQDATDGACAEPLDKGESVQNKPNIVKSCRVSSGDSFAAFQTRLRSFVQSLAGYESSSDPIEFSITSSDSEVSQPPVPRSSSSSKASSSSSSLLSLVSSPPRVVDDKPLSEESCLRETLNLEQSRDIDCISASDDKDAVQKQPSNDTDKKNCVPNHTDNPEPNTRYDIMSPPTNQEQHIVQPRTRVYTRVSHDEHVVQTQQGSDTNEQKYPTIDNLHPQPHNPESIMSPPPDKDTSPDQELLLFGFPDPQVFPISSPQDTKASPGLELLQVEEPDSQSSLNIPKIIITDYDEEQASASTGLARAAVKPLDVEVEVVATVTGKHAKDIGKQDEDTERGEEESTLLLDDFEGADSNEKGNVDQELASCSDSDDTTVMSSEQLTALVNDAETVAASDITQKGMTGDCNHERVPDLSGRHASGSEQLTTSFDEVKPVATNDFIHKEIEVECSQEVVHTISIEDTTIVPKEQRDVSVNGVERVASTDFLDKKITDDFDQDAAPSLRSEDTAIESKGKLFAATVNGAEMVNTDFNGKKNDCDQDLATELNNEDTTSVTTQRMTSATNGADKSLVTSDSNPETCACSENTMVLSGDATPSINSDEVFRDHDENDNASSEDKTHSFASFKTRLRSLVQSLSGYERSSARRASLVSKTATGSKTSPLRQRSLSASKMPSSSSASLGSVLLQSRSVEPELLSDDIPICTARTEPCFGEEQNFAQKSAEDLRSASKDNVVVQKQQRADNDLSGLSTLLPEPNTREDTMTPPTHEEQTRDQSNTRAYTDRASKGKDVVQKRPCDDNDNQSCSTLNTLQPKPNTQDEIMTTPTNEEQHVVPPSNRGYTEASNYEDAVQEQQNSDIDDQISLSFTIPHPPPNTPNNTTSPPPGGEVLADQELLLFEFPNSQVLPPPNKEVSPGQELLLFEFPNSQVLPPPNNEVSPGQELLLFEFPNSQVLPPPNNEVSPGQELLLLEFQNSQVLPMSPPPNKEVSSGQELLLLEFQNSRVHPKSSLIIPKITVTDYDDEQASMNREDTEEHVENHGDGNKDKTVLKRQVASLENIENVGVTDHDPGADLCVDNQAVITCEVVDEYVDDHEANIVDVLVFGGQVVTTGKVKSAVFTDYDEYGELCLDD